MTGGEAASGVRVVEVSPGTLARIAPDAGRHASRLCCLRLGLRRYVRLAWTRARFRFHDFRALRLVTVSCRLRVRLIWLRVRHLGRLSRRTDRGPI